MKIIAEKGKICKISISCRESSAVKRAAGDLCRDLEKICGCRAVLSGEEENEECQICLGTLGG